MKICVVGVGYVGLVTAACLAEAGNKVTCVDNNSDKIEGLKNGVIPIYEPGLTEMVKRNDKLGRLIFTTDLKQGVDDSLIIFIGVGTPSAPDGSADISAVLAVADGIAQNITDYRIIVTKSTVPIGTHKKVIDLIKSKTNTPFDYVSNPEFLREGSAIDDYMRPERIIVGTENPAVREIMKQLYDPFMRKSNRILFMHTVSAELAKYAANAMLATRISFMNEISALCDQIGADVELIRQGIGTDSRIGPSFLFPGVGFGGSCLPKDVRALVHTGAENGVNMALVKAVLEVNSAQQERFTKRVTDYFAGREADATLAVWGLAFKAKTDDVRESPALNCIKKFLDCGMKVKAYDPEAGPPAVEALNGKIELCQNGYDALEGSDALVIFTEWQEFRNPDLEAIAVRLNKPVIFDGKNLFDPQNVQKAGFEYYSVGR